MLEEQSPDLSVDIVSDVVCPWCIVGYRQLEQALADNGLHATIRWHPFELNPQMAEEGENLREHLAAKYGTSDEDSRRARDRLTQIGATLGIEFGYTDDMRMVNTFRAHQLMHWAGTLGRKQDLKMRLFAAFFTHRRDLNDPRILADEAAAIGLDGHEARIVLADGRFANDVREEEQFWTSRGIQGVPTMIFNQKYLVTGAQGIENYSSVLQQLSRDHAA